MSPFITDVEDLDDPDDELLEQTPQYVIDTLGFDPLEFEQDDPSTQDANLIASRPDDTLPEELASITYEGLVAVPNEISA